MSHAAVMAQGISRGVRKRPGGCGGCSPVKDAALPEGQCDESEVWEGDCRGLDWRAAKWGMAKVTWM